MQSVAKHLPGTDLIPSQSLFKTSCGKRTAQTRRTINSRTPHQNTKKPKQKARFGTASNKISGGGRGRVAFGASTSLRSTNPRPCFYLGSSGKPITIGWLVGCFGFNGPLRQYFSLYRAVSQREGERGEEG